MGSGDIMEEYYENEVLPQYRQDIIDLSNENKLLQSKIMGFRRLLESKGPSGTVKEFDAYFDIKVDRHGRIEEMG